MPLRQSSVSVGATASASDTTWLLGTTRSTCAATVLSKIVASIGTPGRACSATSARRST